MGSRTAFRRSSPRRLTLPVVLDTTVLIDVLRGRPGAVAALADLEKAGDRVFTSVVNVEEVVRGLRSAREEQRAERLLAGLRLAPLGLEEGERAGRWRRAFGRRGITLSQSDCLVAAAAVALGAPLATGNPKHFPMVELTVEHWPAGA